MRTQGDEQGQKQSGKEDRYGAARGERQCGRREERGGEGALGARLTSARAKDTFKRRTCGEKGKVSGVGWELAGRGSGDDGETLPRPEAFAVCKGTVGAWEQLVLGND